MTARKVIGGVIGVLIIVVAYAICRDSPRVLRSARDNNCAGNLTAIQIALQQYSTVHGTPPPAAVVDGNGKKLHSWRVLILPYLGESDMFSLYRLNEPWNSSHNLSVTSTMPQVFSCHLLATTAPYTSYLAAVDGDSGLRCRIATPNGVQDANGVVAIIGCEESNIRWNQPEDVAIESVSSIKPDLVGASSGSESTRVLVMTPGSGVEWVPLQATLGKLKEARSLDEDQSKLLFGKFFEGQFNSSTP